jgi:hypothetical protein
VPRAWTRWQRFVVSDRNSGASFEKRFRTDIVVAYAQGVNLQEMIAELDREIARLEQVRRLLTEGEGKAPAKRGRPAGKSATRPAPKRRLSPEGLAHIREAQKRRWAAQKKAAKKNAGAAAKAAE